MANYNHINIEKKWQSNWENNKTFKTDVASDKKKFYALDMFPYPSGAGLHVGHPEGYTATDILSRMKRMQGYEVMHPMGWDAFGLPAEQYAIQTKNHPREFNEKNIANFKSQIKSLGFSYDWDREINTTNPDYYKWSQWIFKKLYENGLAELKNMPVNFCPECGTVLANEEVVDGKCERKGHFVVKKDMNQWILKITKYADRLLEDLEDLDWPESLKDMQRNWIGKSKGANVLFDVLNFDYKIEVYTTRVDTLMGVTYLVIAPENELVQKLTTKEYASQVSDFIKNTVNKSELERTELNKNKSGVFTGSYAIHPITNEAIKIFIGDYVLNHYGTGAVMAVAMHDERDYEFAKKYNLDTKKIIQSKEYPCFVDGELINSGQFNGLKGQQARDTIIKYLEDNNLGSRDTKYKLRDWLFSRQRYWGEPFPIIHLEDGEIVTVADEDLPVVLPMMDEIKPGLDGSSPLKNAKEWLNVNVDSKAGLRETNTMPQWAGSCWYYLRYLDPNNEKELVKKEIADKWLPVDLYIGGAEHAVLHLLYARFWHKFLYDIGVVSTKEPFHKLYNQGMILGEGNVKMSKSIGNVINPDDIVNSHGADTLRLYEMFMGPLDASIAWSEEGIDGSRRFLDRVWRLYENVTLVELCPEMDKVYNQTIKKVTEDYEKLSFNTAISQMMIFVNDATKKNKMSHIQAIGFLKLLNPITPHITEEINSKMGNKELAYSIWPEYDCTKLVEEEFELVLQINGKIKKKVKVKTDLSKDELIIIGKEQLGELLNSDYIVKEIAVVNKLVNFVVKG